MGFRWSLPLLLALHRSFADAQFLWGFNGTSSNSATIIECAQIPIGIFDAVLNQPFKAVPPYYMFAYETSGRTTSQLLGTDSSKLSWQVAHPPGSTLLLQVADSTGASGGVAGLYTVDAGTSSCNEVPSSSSIAIATNLTSEMTADRCSSIAFTISGGKGPYNVSIAAENTTAVTNITMPSGSNVLNFVNTVPLKALFIVGVADSTGTWAQNTGLIQSTGSNTGTCSGKNTFSTATTTTTSSSSSTSTSGSSSSSGSGSGSNSGSSSSDGTSTGAIAGGVVAGILILALAASLGYFFWRRHRRSGQGTRALPPLLDTWDMKHGRNASGGAGAALTNYAAVPDGYGGITPYTPEPTTAGLGVGGTERGFRTTTYADSESRYDSSTGGYERSRRGSNMNDPFGGAASTVSFDPYADPYGGIETEGVGYAAAGAGAGMAGSSIATARQHSTYPPSQAATSAAGWADVSNHGRSDSTADSSSSGGRRRSTGPLIAVNGGHGGGYGPEGAAMTEKRQLAERHMRQDRDAIRRQQGGGPSASAMAGGSTSSDPSSVWYQHQDAEDIVEELPPAYRDR